MVNVREVGNAECLHRINMPLFPTYLTSASAVRRVKFDLNENDGPFHLQ